MRKITSIIVTVLLVVLTSFSDKNVEVESKIYEPTFSINQYAFQLYDCIADQELNKEALDIALKGYYSLLSKNRIKNQKYLTIVDMSLSANVDRFFVIDMETQKLVSKSLVAHGRNTGQEYASKFSNIEASFQTSLGFYKTAETYIGKRGFSLKLDGLEYSNNKARARGIIIHGADYVSEKFIKNNNRLGRSLGCPSLPVDSFKATVKLIKAGSCLFIYYPKKSYLTKSKFVNEESNYLLTSSGMISDFD